jgi:phage-related protein
MSKFEIIFYQTLSGKNPILDFIKKLNSKDQAKIAWTIDLLAEHGRFLPLPYLKSLQNAGNLWELRPKNYRIFLSFLQKRNIILLHAIIKKTNKTPIKEITLSTKRLADYLGRKI